MPKIKSILSQSHEYQSFRSSVPLKRISVDANDPDNALTVNELALYKCTEDDLGLNGSEKSKFYPINEEEEIILDELKDLFYCFD